MLRLTVPSNRVEVGRRRCPSRRRCPGAPSRPAFRWTKPSRSSRLGERRVAVAVDADDLGRDALADLGLVGGSARIISPEWRVEVDEPGRDDLAGGVDRPRGRPWLRARRRRPPSRTRSRSPSTTTVPRPPRRTGAIDDRAAGDEDARRVIGIRPAPAGRTVVRLAGRNVAVERGDRGPATGGAFAQLAPAGGRDERRNAARFGPNPERRSTPAGPPEPTSDPSESRIRRAVAPAAIRPGLELDVAVALGVASRYVHVDAAAVGRRDGHDAITTSPPPDPRGRRSRRSASTSGHGESRRAGSPAGSPPVEGDPRAGSETPYW